MGIWGNIVKAVINGRLNDGSLGEMAVTEEGHLEVEIHGPLSPFGSVHTESMTPVFQFDAVYGLNSEQEKVTSIGSGTATATNGLFTVDTGTTIYSFGTLQSTKRLRYRSGQGSILRFTAMFPTPVADSILVAGLGHAEDGFYIGYNGTSYGILYSLRGVRACNTLTVTTGSSTAENLTITLNSIPYTVAVTNSGNIQRTVYEISLGTYAGWTAQAVGSTVVFLNNSAAARSGTFTLAGSTAIGTFATTKVGSAATDTWIAQADWNGDKLDGTGSSGMTINPQKLNVFQIGVQYLGAGKISFECETVSPNDNNPTFTMIHTFKFPNTLTLPSVGNPSFPFTMASYSAGSTTSLPVSTGSVAGFIEGPIVRQGPRFSYRGSSTGVTAAAYKALFTISNKIQYGGRSNQSTINLISLSGAIKHDRPVSILLIKNATLLGNPSFTSYSNNSSSNYDIAATTCTFATNDQLIFSTDLGDTGNFIFSFSDEIALQPGESVTIAAITSFGTASYVLATLNTREDQ